MALDHRGQDIAPGKGLLSEVAGAPAAEARQAAADVDIGHGECGSGTILSVRTDDVHPSLVQQARTEGMGPIQVRKRRMTRAGCGELRSGIRTPRGVVGPEDIDIEAVAVVHVVVTPGTPLIAVFWRHVGEVDSPEGGKARRDSRRRSEVTAPARNYVAHGLGATGGSVLEWWRRRKGL